MTIRFDPPPDVHTFVAALDRGAQESANDARRIGTPVVRAALPARSGRARRGTTGRVGRTGTGYRLTFAATSRVRYPNGISAVQVVRFIHTGTGVYGPTGKPIRPRKRGGHFHLPSGWKSGTIQGQRGHDYFGAAQHSLDGIVYRLWTEGAQRAGRWAAETI